MHLFTLHIEVFSCNYMTLFFQILLEDLENQRPAIAAADEAVKRLIAQGVEDPAEGERQ